MLIRRSALLLALLAAASVGLLLFSTGPHRQAPSVRIKSAPASSGSQANERNEFSTWDMISEIMLRPAA